MIALDHNVPERCFSVLLIAKRWSACSSMQAIPVENVSPADIVLFLDKLMVVSVFLLTHM